jgi:hypothetical protein
MLGGGVAGAAADYGRNSLLRAAVSARASRLPCAWPTAFPTAYAARSVTAEYRSAAKGDANAAPISKSRTVLSPPVCVTKGRTLRDRHRFAKVRIRFLSGR